MQSSRNCNKVALHNSSHGHFEGHRIQESDSVLPGVQQVDIIVGFPFGSRAKVVWIEFVDPIFY